MWPCGHSNEIPTSVINLAFGNYRKTRQWESTLRISILVNPLISLIVVTSTCQGSYESSCQLIRRPFPVHAKILFRPLALRGHVTNASFKQ